MASAGNNTTFAEVSANARAYKVPAFIFIGFLAMIGFIGNLFVLYFYGCVVKKQKMQHFITLLAVYDIIGCLLGIPLRMFELRMPVTYPSGSLCKIQNAVICFTCVASSLTLLIISIDRYQTVCRPTKPQLTLIHVKISVCVITLVSMGFAVVASVVYDRSSHPLVEGSEVIIDICSMDPESTITKAYFMALLAVLLIVLVSLSVLYSLVWRTTKKYVADTTVMNSISGSSSQTDQPETTRRTSQTRILILLSLLYLISFVPSLVFSLIFKDISRKTLSFNTKVCIELVYSTWVLNSSLNPIIYGFFSRRFILHVRSIFDRCVTQE